MSVKIDSRSDKEKNDVNFNYYHEFKIDPNENDNTKIEDIIKKKKNHYTAGGPKNQRLNQLYAEAIVIMTNPIFRTEAHQMAKHIKLAEAKAFFMSKARNLGHLYKSDYKKIADNSDKWLTIADLETATVDLIELTGEPIDDTQKILDFKNYEEIEKFLKTTGKEDLYDLFSNPNETFSKSTPAPKLFAESDVVYRSVPPAKAKEPKNEAIQKVCGLAKIVFKDENVKKNYDIYLDAKKEVWDELAHRKRLNMFEIEMKEYLVYVEKLKIALNIKDVVFIETILTEGVNYYSISILGGDGRKKNLENCPYCDKAYDSATNPKVCPYQDQGCGKPLVIPCWNCGNDAPFTVKNKTCPKCEATKDHGQRFLSIVSKIDTLLVTPGVLIKDLQYELNTLKIILPDYSKVTTSKLVTKVADYQDKIDKLIIIEETTGKTYKEEYDKIIDTINLKKIFTASGEASALKNKYPTYNIVTTDTLIKRINDVISKIRLHGENAKTYSAQNNEDATINEIASALDLTTDYIEAQQIISKFPPQMPISVNISIKDDSALVSWKISKQQKLITFTVIRKSGSAPTSINDGTEVASGLSIDFFEDTTIVSDTPYYYGVFSTRLGVISSITCTTSPVTTYFDVSNIQQDIIPNKIVVKWEAPLNVSEVEVIKKKGLNPPTGREDGQKLSVRNNSSFEDSDFDRAGNSYLFICIYKNDKGINCSKGVIRTFKAFEEIKPLLNVKIEQNSTTSFRFKSDSVVSGKRGVYYNSKEIHCDFGKTLQITDFKNMHKEIKETSLLISDDTIASFNLPENNSYYVYPVIYNEQLIIVSKPVILNTMTGMSNIKHTETNNEVIITGQPHTHAKNIIAKISHSEFPTTINSDGEKLSVSKDDFIKSGMHIKLKMDVDNYISVFSETEFDGIKSITHGVKLQDVITFSTKVTVRYAINANISNTKPFSIKIDFESEVPTSIPILTLIKGSPKPLSANEGQLVDRTNAFDLKKGLFTKKYTGSLTIKSQPVAKNTKFALFSSNDNKSISFKEVIKL